MNLTSNSHFSAHFVAIALFALITIIYCWPALNGQKINQSDYKQFLGMSKEIVDFRSETGEEALWTNSMFGGMPAYQISVKYSNNILVYIDKAFQLFLPRPIGIVFLYFLGFYILLLSLKIPPHLSILGALAFGFSSYFFIIIEVGHNTKAHSIAYMAPALAGMIFCFKKNNLIDKLPGFLLSFLFLGLHLRANHLQITYYFLFILFAFWLNFLINFSRSNDMSGFLKSTFVFIIAGLFAIAINIGNIWSTYEYSHYTTRGASELEAISDNQTSGLNKDYATSYSYGKMEVFNMLFPNFMGGASGGKLSQASNVYQTLINKGYSSRESSQYIKALPLYFGPQQFTAGPVYIGALVWLLFFIALFTIKKPIKWILLFLIGFSIFLAWGRHLPFLTNLFLDYFPLYNKFRTVSMILIIVEFLVPLLAILGLHQFISLNIKDLVRRKIILYSSGFLIAISLFFLVFGNLLFDFTAPSDLQYPSWFSNALVQDRIDLYQSDIKRSLLFICLGSFVLYLGFVIRKLSNLFTVSFLVIILLFDMWFVNKRYFNNDDFVLKSKVEIPFELQPFDREIKKDTSVYRVYNLTERLDQGARTSYFHHSLGGYHGAKLGKYQDIIDKHLYMGNVQVINMLNAKYIISSDANNKPVVHQNPSALGNAWFINSINWVNNADEEINSLSFIDTQKTASINKKYKSSIDSIDSSNNSSIQLISYKPNKLIYSAQVEGNSLAVFSEIFYPKGWQAYINGKPVFHFPVNYILRGLVLPKGNHEVVFEFKPRSFFVSSKISFFASLILISTALLSCIKLFKRKK